MSSPTLSWNHFLAPYECDSSEFARGAASGRTVLVTGAGGFIGSALVKAIVRGGCQRIILLDSSVNALFEIQQYLSTHCEVPFDVVVGNVCDELLLDNILRQFRPEQIYHTAAFKHVPLAEFNPVAAVRDNAVGTWALAKAARRFSRARVTAVSTDKAVNPRSIMGASKRIAELSVVTASTTRCTMNGVRLGNIIGSTGSVVPHFLSCLAAGHSLAITHPDVTRYFMPLSAALDAILFCSGAEMQGRILLPSLGEPTRIVDLANFLAQHYIQKDAPCEFVGLRPGEKLHEELLLRTESVDYTSLDRFAIVSTPTLDANLFNATMERLRDATSRHDVAQVLQIVRILIPEYSPSDELQRSILCAAGSR